MVECRHHGAYNDYASNPIPTSLFGHAQQPPSSSAITLLGTALCSENRCRDGVACVVIVCPVLPVQCYLYTYVVSVAFGTTIPTSLSIFGKCFLHL